MDLRIVDLKSLKVLGFTQLALHLEVHSGLNFRVDFYKIISIFFNEIKGLTVSFCTMWTFYHVVTFLLTFIR